MKKAICLISGGLDSSVTGYIAKKQGYEIYAITFNYGQRHKKEIESAKKIAKSLKVKKHLLFNIDFEKIGGSSLVEKDLDVEINHDIKDIGKKIPSTYVPARNTIFLSIALAYAESVDADSIFIGVNSVDYSAYPDCRPEFIKTFEKLANIATKKGVKGKKIKIKTPLLYMSKSEIIKKGFQLKVPFEKTWSCYIGEEKACGRCESCILRLKGFKDAKKKDPLEYENVPTWV